MSGLGGFLNQMGNLAEMAAREEHRQQRELDQMRGQLINLMQKLDKTAKKLHKRPLKDFKIHYSKGQEFEGEPVDVEASGMTAQISPLDEVTGETHLVEFEPESETRGAVTVTLHEMILSEYGVFLGLTVDVAAGAQNQTVDWVNTNSPHMSKIVLVDPENSEYYYPIETDLLGAVFAGRPRSGVVAFQALRAVTSCLEIHFTNIQVSGDEEAASLSFQICADAIRVVSEHLVNLPPFHLRLVHELYGPDVAIEDVWPERATQSSADRAPGGSAKQSQEVVPPQVRQVQNPNRAVRTTGGCGCPVLVLLGLLVAGLAGGILAAL